MVAARKHRILGNIDLRLAAFMVLGTIAGSELGVQAIEALKRMAKVDLVVGVATIIVLVAISLFVFLESWQALKLKGSRKPAQPADLPGEGQAGVPFIAHWTHSLDWAPKMGLPHSGIKSISIWAILIVSFVGGIFSGFLGGGAGYIRMPCMVYLLGIPTHIAIGTDLFEIVVSTTLRLVSPRHQRKRRCPDRLDHANRRGRRRANRSGPDPILQRSPHPPRLRSPAPDRRGLDYLWPGHRPPYSLRLFRSARR